MIFEFKGFKGKRKFTLFETYGILNEWQGQGKWGMMQSIKKERLAKIINSGNYKNLASEFSLLVGEDKYKSKDKFSPKEVKKLLGLSTTSLWKLRKDGKLEFSKPNNSTVYYSKESIQQWIEGTKTEAFSNQNKKG